MDLLHQFARSLHLPAQIWDSAGEPQLTNARFNETLGFPALCDWSKSGLKLLDDAQLQDETLQDCFKRALGGLPVELHGIKYLPERNGYLAPGAGALNLSLILRPLPLDCSTPDCIVCLISDFVGTGERYDEGLIRGQKLENVEILASGVAHEFNNIFTGIKGMTDLIKYEVNTKSDVYEFAESIEEAILRGADLIQKLSVFAREMPFALRRHKLSAYLEHAIPILDLQVRRRVKLEVNLVDDAEVLCDPHRLDQAVGHIVVNARDAMAGQGSVLITARHAAPAGQSMSDAEGNQQWIMLEFADSGPGIPEEVGPRVLEPFYSTKERGKSTGLGLTVTHRIVTGMNGVIEIGNSVELGGAAVRLYLPVATGSSAKVSAETAGTAATP